MDDRFDREFYSSRWQRVLPLGPGGIQPYVRTGHSPALSAAAAGLHRLATIVQAALAYARRAAVGMASWRGGVASGTQCCP